MLAAAPAHKDSDSDPIHGEDAIGRGSRGSASPTRTRRAASHAVGTLLA